jgi:hypothetical protein
MTYNLESNSVEPDCIVCEYPMEDHLEKVAEYYGLKKLEYTSLKDYLIGEHDIPKTNTERPDDMFYTPLFVVTDNEELYINLNNTELVYNYIKLLLDKQIYYNNNIAVFYGGDMYLHPIFDICKDLFYHKLVGHFLPSTMRHYPLLRTVYLTYGI